MSISTEHDIRPAGQRRLVRRSLRSFQRRGEVGERRHRRELNLERLGCRGLATPSCVHQLVTAICFTDHQSPISDLLHNLLQRVRIEFLWWDILLARIRRWADTPIR